MSATEWTDIKPCNPFACAVLAKKMFWISSLTCTHLIFGEEKEKERERGGRGFTEERERATERKR